MKKSISLLVFIKGDHQHNIPGCANYYNDGCVLRRTCKIEKGKRCLYFEKTVLPVAAELGIGGSIGDAYADKVGLVGFRPQMTKEARRCLCGAILLSRQRYCEKCSKRRRRESYRKMRDSKRLTRHS